MGIGTRSCLYVHRDSTLGQSVSTHLLTPPTSRVLLDSNTSWFNDGRSSILPRYRGLSHFILHDDTSTICNLRYQSANTDILLLMNPTLWTPNRVPKFEINSAEHSRRFIVEIRKQTLCYEEWLKPIAMHLISHRFPDKQRPTNCINSTQAIKTLLSSYCVPMWKSSTQTNRCSIKTRIERSMPLKNLRLTPFL